MDSLAFGKITNSKEGHIIETIASNKLSIVFNSCNIDTSLPKIMFFHVKCTDTIRDKMQVNICDDLPSFIGFAIRDIINFIYVTTPEKKLTVGIDAELLINDGYIRYTIIAPYYPEKFYLVEKIIK